MRMTKNQSIIRMSFAAAIAANALALAGPAFAEEITNGPAVKPVEEEAGGLGLTAGAELGLGNVADEAELGLTPSVAYENSFGGFDLAAELDYTFTFGDPLAQELYAEEEIAYNLALGAGTLSLILNNNNTVYVDPAPEAGATHEGVVEPSVQYTHPLSFGDLYARPGLPVTYLTGVSGDDPAVGCRLTLGWASAFGLGLECAFDMDLAPEPGYAGASLLASYENGPVYGEIEFVTDGDLKNFEINPEVDYTLGAFTFTIRAEIGIPEDGGASIVPFVGVGYSL